MTIASRVMKARKRSCCCLCGAIVVPGMQIGLIGQGDDRNGWAHVACIITRLRPAA